MRKPISRTAPRSARLSHRGGLPLWSMRPATPKSISRRPSLKLRAKATSSDLRIAPRLIARDEVWGTYHFAGSGVTTFHGFASRIVAAQAPITGAKPRVTAITSAEFPTPARRPANSELDCGLFARTFGFGG